MNILNNRKLIFLFLHKHGNTIHGKHYIYISWIH